MSAPDRIVAGEDENSCEECAIHCPLGLGCLVRAGECAECGLIGYEYIRADLTFTPAEIAQVREMLAEISRQKKTTELETEYDVEVADFEDGYDMCVDTARAAFAILNSKGAK